jgi:hypothetical protein
MDYNTRLKSCTTRLIVALSTVAAVAMVFGFVLLSAQDGGAAEGTRTPRPTIRALLDLQVQQTPEPTVTPTPSPDFAATQRALDKEREQHEAGIRTQAALAANLATATEAAHQNRMNEMDYQGAVAALAYQMEIHEDSTRMQKEKNDLEIANHARYLRWHDNIRLIWEAAWLSLIFFASVSLVMLFFWNLVPRKQKAKSLRLEVHNPDTKWTRFGSLPVDVQRFRVFALNAIDGKTLAYEHWAGDGKIFSRPEYDKLTALLLEMGVMEYKHPDFPQQGQRLTKPGAAALRAYLEGE